MIKLKCFRFWYISIYGGRLKKIFKIQQQNKTTKVRTRCVFAVFPPSPKVIPYWHSRNLWLHYISSKNHINVLRCISLKSTWDMYLLIQNIFLCSIIFQINIVGVCLDKLKRFGWPMKLLSIEMVYLEAISVLIHSTINGLPWSYKSEAR